MQVDPGPPLAPLACGPKSDGSKWLHVCQALKEKGLGQRGQHAQGACSGTAQARGAKRSPASMTAQ